MAEKYNHKTLDDKWQKRWRSENLYKAGERSAEDYYLFVELAYSSGDLHIGHWFSWTAPDIYARLKRMQGYSVLFPVGGFDSFGLPAENAAINRGVHPMEWTNKNIEAMRGQFETMGPSFDWDAEVVTSDPDYYRWTQWLFLKLYEHGLVYRDKVLANWCPADNTVLANEHVIDGRCWRHPETKVQQREVEQWLVRITDYADKLLWPENPSVDWPKEHTEGQNNWIGRSEGAEVKFELKNSRTPGVRVFTTRLDTINGATFLAISPEFAREFIVDLPEEKKESVTEYINKSLSRSPRDRHQARRGKTGIELGIAAINPATGKEMPVWVSDYVLPEVGTGAVMGVPEQDARDRAFAEKFGLPIVPAYTSKSTRGQLFSKKIAKKKTVYRLRDWSVSRHRYWGAPIPIIYCDKCGTVPAPEEDLPVKLPERVDYTPTGKPPLATAEGWVKTNCPKCDGPAKRETETMDTFVDSSWYFLRYPDPKNGKVPFDRKLINQWLPAQVYFGGREHVHGHTLYARFITKFLNDIGVLGFDEFALKRINHGVVLGPDGTKMSKSKGNIVSPNEEVKKYGADTVRMYLAFMGPHENAAPWKQEGVEGIRRFLDRVWRLYDGVVNTPGVDELSVKMHQTIKKVTEELENFRFNTAISAIMEYVSALRDINRSGTDTGQGPVRRIPTNHLIVLAQLLAPFAPHMAEELWVEKLGQEYSVHLADWPKYDEKLIQSSMVTVPVQVDGKLRSQLTVNSLQTTDKTEIINKAKSDSKVLKYIKGKKIKSEIYVEGKIINFVTV